jgi:hypothetical protein
MKEHTTNYVNTFIEVALDCPVEKGTIPPEQNGKKTIANYQFDLLKSNPYKFTSDEVFFKVFAIRNDLTKQEMTLAREKFFSKGKPCFRASPLTKKYGWGIHSNSESKIAMFAMESDEYERLTKQEDLKVVKAMRSKK